jgi:hypothetical protein
MILPASGDSDSSHDLRVLWDVRRLLPVYLGLRQVPGEDGGDALSLDAVEVDVVVVVLDRWRRPGGRRGGPTGHLAVYRGARSAFEPRGVTGLLEVTVGRGRSAVDVAPQQ